MKSEDRYDSLFHYYSELHSFSGNDWLRFKAQVKAESNFDPNARSSVGALGLAQFMPPTWKEWSDGTPGIQEMAKKIWLIDPRDPEDAINSQVLYMKWLLRRVSTWECAFAAYNWGIGNILKIWSNPQWKILLPKETYDYIYRIDEYYQEYLDG